MCDDDAATYSAAMPRKGLNTIAWGCPQAFERAPLAPALQT